MTSHSLFLSKWMGSTKSMISSTNYYLINSSNIVSLAKLGLELTSITQHFKLSSIIISNPNNSNELGFYGISCYPAKRVITTTYYILFQIYYQEYPLSLILLSNIFKLILVPPYIIKLYPNTPNAHYFKKSFKLLHSLDV